MTRLSSALNAVASYNEICGRFRDHSRNRFKLSGASGVSCENISINEGRFRDKSVEDRDGSVRQYLRSWQLHFMKSKYARTSQHINNTLFKKFKWNSSDSSEKIFSKELCLLLRRFKNKPKPCLNLDIIHSNFRKENSTTSLALKIFAQTFPSSQTRSNQI